MPFYVYIYKVRDETKPFWGLLVCQKVLAPSQLNKKIFDKRKSTNVMISKLKESLDIDI